MNSYRKIRLRKINKLQDTEFFMELLKDKLKKELICKPTSINMKVPISGTNWASLSVTSLCGSPLSLDLVDKNFKLRFQTLISGTCCFEEGNYRIDNCHGEPLHSHFWVREENLKFKNNLTPIILGSIFKMILGSEYKEIEESLK